MTHYLSNISESVKAWLPQNTHAMKAASLTQEVTSLEHSLTDKTGRVFQFKVSETVQMIAQEKEKCLQALKRMNGDYYQDPKSVLKKNWDKLVESVKSALNIEVERLDQLPTISSQLEIAAATEKTGNATKKIESYKNATKKIESYKTVEQKRNDCQAQLERIIATEKASTTNIDEQLKLKKESLLQVHKELCGDYFGDAKGQLDRAWRKYETALAHGSTGDNTFATYERLESRRKKIEAELYSIDRELSLPASTERTYETLTTESITKQTEYLKKESELSGVDWKGIVATASKTALLAAGAGAGYILLS